MLRCQSAVQHPFLFGFLSGCVIPNEVRDLPAYEALQAFDVEAFLIVISHCGVCKSLKSRDDAPLYEETRSGAALLKNLIIVCRAASL
jgi:hypothetical protein